MPALKAIKDPIVMLIDALDEGEFYHKYSISRLPSSIHLSILLQSNWDPLSLLRSLCFASNIQLTVNSCQLMRR
jgi:hypothetical protein